MHNRKKETVYKCIDSRCSIKVKLCTCSKYHVKKEHEGEEVLFHVFVLHTVYLICVRRIPDTY